MLAQSPVNHEYFMNLALLEAKEAAMAGEVPVGALIVRDGSVIASARNFRESYQDPLAHAEILAIQRASQTLQSWRLLDCTLYVTLEPCVMCAGAIVQARIPQLVYGATDPKGGGVRSLYQICEDERLNHRVSVVEGVLREDCGRVLTEFFQERRLEKSSALSAKIEEVFCRD